MNKDVFERKNSELYEQLNLLKEYVAQHGANLNLSNAEINLIGQLCDEYRAQILLVTNKRAEYKSEAARKRDMRLTHLKPLRSFLNKMKNPAPGTPRAQLPNFKSRLTQPDSQTYVPKIKVSVDVQGIKVGFKKLGVEQMEIWGSLSGGKFELLGMRLRSPFLFKPPAQADNALQHWAIKAVGRHKDQSFGKWSRTIDVFYFPPKE